MTWDPGAPSREPEPRLYWLRRCAASAANFRGWPAWAALSGFAVLVAAAVVLAAPVTSGPSVHVWHVELLPARTGPVVLLQARPLPSDLAPSVSPAIRP